VADDDDTPSMKRAVTPRSAKLPSTTPDGTRKVVAALAELAGPASRERLASRMGVQLTGGVARSLASALLYGFIAVDSDNKLVITDRGLAFLGADAEAVKHAERQAVMSTGFGVVIKKLTTRKADAEVVAFRLQEDQGIPESSSKDRAQVLVSAATSAGLVTNGNFDGGVIEDTIAVVGEPEVPAPTESRTASTPSKSTASLAAATSIAKGPKTNTRATGAATKEGRSREEPDLPFEQPVAPLQVVLQIDASMLDAGQIGEIVRELRASVKVSTSDS
jgi:hypothetical protein